MILPVERGELDGNHAGNALDDLDDLALGDTLAQVALVETEGLLQCGADVAQDYVGVVVVGVDADTAAKAA